MAINYIIQIDDFYLSSTGAAVTGSVKGCALDVKFPNNLKSRFIKNARPDMNGNVYAEYTETPAGANKLITIIVQSLPLTVGQMIEEAQDEFDSSGEDIDLIGTHPTDSGEDFSYTAKLMSYNKGNMSPGQTDWEQAEIVFLTTGVTTP